VSVIRHIVNRPASWRPHKEEDWRQALGGLGDVSDGCLLIDPDDLLARVNGDWWKTATLDS
jgi:hypothetical protein